MRRPVASLLAVSALIVISAQPASAATIVYTDLTAFQAASSTTNIDFSGIAPDGGFQFFGLTPLVVGPVTFQTPTASMFVVDANFNNCCHFPESVAPATLFDNDPARGLAFNVSLVGTYTAVAFDIANSSTSPVNGGADIGGDVTVSLSNGVTHTFANTTWPNFIGFTTDMPFVSLSISTSANGVGNGFVELTNFRYGTATAVPEPASLAFVGLGLFSLVAASVRSQRHP